MKATTIAVSEENHWLLSRYKQGAGARSMDEALRMLLDGGPHTVWHLMLHRGDAVRRACSDLGITHLTAFGSRVRGAAHRRSDLDLVASFEAPYSRVDVIGAQDALSEAFGIDVDLHTWTGLKPRVAARATQEGVELLA